MSDFANMLKTLSSVSSSENGAQVYNTTGTAMLDLFANIGGMRGRPDSDIISAWRAARAEDEELADNCVLYARNIRAGGLGERKIGRLLLHELALLNPEKVEKNFMKIVECGRWDDLFSLFNTPVENAMLQFIQTQLTIDIHNAVENKPISLLAKWLPSSNTSSKETRTLARKIYTAFEIDERTYRKTLSYLRLYLKIVERYMSSGQWDKIDFEAVPSVAMSRYIKTFNQHLPEKFAEYKEKLKSGEAKVNAATLYPYDIIRPYLTKRCGWGGDPYATIDEVQEAQWNALPNYVKEDEEIVCICDTSGSMTCDEFRPLATAIGLGVYFAQRNKGQYHNIFINFSSQPTIHKIEDGWNLQTCVNKVLASNWGYSTNLDKTFELIYNIAKATMDVPKALVIISDMEINSWSGGDEYLSITEKWEEKYREIGLKCPKLIYWNVASRHDNTLAKCTDNVGFVSGSSAGAFQFMQTLINKSAYEAMREILTKPEYTWN